jgi:putative two-component system response regulator
MEEETSVLPIVLALDDSTFDLKRVKTILEGKYDVRCTQKPEQAFNLMQKEHIDVLLLDVEMPGMSGIKFLTKAQKQGLVKNTHVLFTTAHTEPKTMDKALGIGANGYILKPLDADNLLKKLEWILNAKG